MTQKEGMRKVQMYDFALIDAGLFLDTHPDDREALRFYRETKELYLAAKEEYEAGFGPLTALDSGTESEWTWVEAPWPWEVEK